MGREREEVEAEPQRSHIVIIGGGFAGLAAARSLSKGCLSLYRGYRTTKGSQEPPPLVPPTLSSRWNSKTKL